MINTAHVCSGSLTSCCKKHNLLLAIASYSNTRVVLIFFLTKVINNISENVTAHFCIRFFYNLSCENRRGRTNHTAISENTFKMICSRSFTAEEAQCKQHLSSGWFFNWSSSLLFQVSKITQSSGDKPNWALLTISDKEEIRTEITSLVMDVIR